MRRLYLVLYFLYFLNQVNGLKTGTMCRTKNFKSRVCENLVVMPKIVSEAIKSEIVRKDTNNINIDYQVSIEKLKKFLLKSSLLEDEKTWNDRPIKTVKGIFNSVEAALNELETLYKLSGGSLNKAKANEILDRYFDPIASEVFSSSKSGLLGSAEFSAEPNSIAHIALHELEASNDKPVNSSQWSEMATTALSELLKLTKSIGSKAQRSKIKFKVYSESQFSSFINETYDYLSSKSTKNWNSKVFDRNFDWNQTLRRSSSTVIPLPFEAIVPGGRFAEVYYWDSYWVVRGLASAGKLELMMNQVKNYFYLIDTYGFVPNGARTYYLDRSQPPLLGEMVWVIVKYLLNHNETFQLKTFAQQALPRLLTEYLGFWMNPLTNHVVDVSTGTYSNPTPQASNTRDIISQIINENLRYLNRYHSFVTAPRPESYLADLDQIRKFANARPGESDNKFMQDIRAAAESGWDFSSRWNRRYVEGQNDLKGELFFTSIDTTNILPCDLNSILHSLERTIVELLDLASSKSEAKDGLVSIFDSLHRIRHKTISNLMLADYDENGNKALSIFDYDFKFNKTSNVVSAAVIMSSRILWLNLKLPSRLKGNGGVSATEFETGQQWDWPNAWPPLQTYFLGDEYIWNKNEFRYYPDFWEATQLFLASAKLSFTLLIQQKNTKGFFFEKYNAKVPGLGGSGGEYINQVGFGWTNGLLIELFSRFCTVEKINSLEKTIKDFFV